MTGLTRSKKQRLTYIVNSAENIRISRVTRIAGAHGSMRDCSASGLGRTRIGKAARVLAVPIIANFGLDTIEV